MAKVLLVNPHNDIREGKERIQPPIPLNLIYVGTFIEDKHSIKIFDRNLNLNDEYFIKFLEEYNPDIIGFGLTTSEVLFDFIHLGRLIKKEFPKKIVIAGGVHPTIEPDSILSEPYVDYIIRGEGEEALLEFCDTFDKNPPKLKKLKNINKNPLRPFINMEKIKLPNYNLVDLKKYDTFYLSLSRGCPGNCTFCYSCKMWGVNGKPFIRAYSKEKAIQAVMQLVEKYQIKTFSIVDDNFIPFKQRAIEICHLLEKYKVHFFCFGRADYVNDEVLSALKKAGCHTVQIGIESGSQRILDLLDKRINVKQNYDAIMCCKRNEIVCDASFMIGLPTETVDDVKKTEEFIKMAKPDLVNLKIFLPLPGTELFDYCVTKGLIDKPKTLEEWGNWMGNMAIVNHNVSEISDAELLRLANKFKKIGLYKYRVKRFIYWVKIGEYRYLAKTIIKKLKKRNFSTSSPG